MADLMIRLPDHKMSRIGELLPQNWLSLDKEQVTQ
ncbi:MAG: hypothetical protein EXR77_18045 [Myxococcales bacterium]|nr:hypothetical protein [Myxococcales bacterium]